MNTLSTPQIQGLRTDELRGLTSAPEQTDVDFFNAAMGRSTQSAKDFMQSVVGPLGSRLDSVGKLSEQATHALKHASVSTNPQDLMKLNRSLSEYYLQSSLTAKVVSKSAQSLDKLTNMQ